MILTKHDWIYQLYLKEQIQSNMKYKLGTRGLEIRQAQEKLGCLVTSVYDTDTFRKVLEFQAQNDLPQTGELDDLTYNTMFPSTTAKSSVVEQEPQEELVTKPKKESNAGRS